MKKVFKKARQASPAIIFFDEIDSVAPRRGGHSGTDHNATEKVVNQLDLLLFLCSYFILKNESINFLYIILCFNSA